MVYTWALKYLYRDPVQALVSAIKVHGAFGLVRAQVSGLRLEGLGFALRALDRSP